MLKSIAVTSVLCALSGLAAAGNMGKTEGYANDNCQGHAFRAAPWVGASLSVINNYARWPAAYKGFGGRINAGYGKLLNQSIYIGGEVFGSDNFRVRDLPLNNSRLTGISSSWSYGFDLIPGILMNQFLLGYVRLGVLNTYFNDVRHQRTGLEIGIGGQANVRGNVDIRAEYVYSEYTNFYRSVQPNQDHFNLGLVYKFV